MDHGNDDKDDNNYKDNASDGDDNDEIDDEVLREADAPLEDENLRRVYLLPGVMRTNQDYDLGPTVPLPDALVPASATFEVLELQVPMCFASCLLVYTGRFLEEDPLISFCCLG
jgi:hypothetical protein